MTEAYDYWLKCNPVTVWMTDNGVAQEELAVRMGVARQTVYSWQHGTHGLSEPALERLSALMETTEDELRRAMKVWKGKVPGR